MSKEVSKASEGPEKIVGDNASELAVYLSILHNKIKEIDGLLIKQLPSLSVQQLDTLAILYEQQPCSMQRLARLCGCSRSNMSLLIDKLVKAKFVRRATDKNDRRVICVELTSRGRKIFAKKAVHIKRLSEQLLDVLRKDEQKRYLDYFGRWIKEKE